MDKEATADSTKQDTQDLSQWRALSPWSMISNIVKTVIQIFSNGFALIPIVYTGWQKGFSLQWSLIATSVLLLLLSISAFIEWRRFRFRINNDQLEVKRGLLFTKKNEIPLNKIQNIRYELPFYFRPLNLATLVVETAGSAKDEASLSALGVEEAYALKATLLKKNSQTSTHENQAQAATNASNMEASSATLDDAQESTLLTKRSLKELVIFGLYQNNFIWFAIVAGPVAGQIQWEEVFNMPFFQQALLWADSHTQQNFALQFMLFISLLLFFYGLISAISILASVLKYHPYRLRESKQTLQRSGGVISHQQDSLKIHRVQILHFEQPVIARLFKRWTLYFKQVRGQEVEQRTKKHMLLPSLTRTEIAPLLSQLPKLSGAEADMPKKYQSININWFYKRAQLAMVPATIVSIVLTLLPEPEAPPYELYWGITAMIIGLLFLRFKQWGYVIEEDVVWQHTGLLGHNWKRIPYDKIQHVRLTQTRAQAKSGLAYLELGLASGTLLLPYIPIDIANKVVAKLMNRVSHDHSNWI
ncbi:PH domain-containing protein [Shewanella maritima]|uniref:PH domain-containing protein n=1 Tax=Shewanella maritima TaxID=2520507 RepID=UPI003735A50C